MAPIWNRASTGTSFTAYGDTIGGSSITTVLGPSLACLSCHDGVTTFDNIVNRPGKDVKGTSVAGNWTFEKIQSSGTYIVNSFQDWEDLGGSKRWNIGNLGSGGLNPGVGLSDDHPVGVPYGAGTKASLRATSTVISGINLYDDLLASATDGSAPNSVNMNSNLWSVAGFVSDTATIEDLLRGGNVECGSCHDPHFNNKSWIEVQSTWDAWWDTTAGYDASNGLFLRRVGGNSGSGVCRTCHEK
jgi:hypothetical protein